MILNYVKTPPTSAERQSLYLKVSQKRDAWSKSGLLPSSTADRLTKANIPWPNNKVHYLIFLILLIFDLTQEREENKLKEVSSPCCTAATCNFHYHSHATLYSLFSAMLLPELHLAIFHQLSDSRLFFLCFLSLLHSSTVITFSAQGTILSLSCMLYHHHNFMQFTVLFTSIPKKCLELRCFNLQFLI